jgi:hypothetical protein
MAQTGFTPIQIYRSSTASAAPTSGNLVAGELAINTADGKLFYLDNLNAVQVIGWKLVPVSAGGTGTTTSTGTGSVVLSDSPTFTTAITSTGALQLTGSDTVAQNIATAQTTGSLSIGGASATGSIAIGRSTGNQTVSIAVGNTASGSTKTVNIGAGGSAGGICNIVLGGVSTTTLITARGAIQNKVYTVATLPTGAVGMRAFVSDALNTAFNDIATSGGSVGTGNKPVYHDGTYWRIG